MTGLTVHQAMHRPFSIVAAGRGEMNAITMISSPVRAQRGKVCVV
jgi:hypothetical protein